MNHGKHKLLAVLAAALLLLSALPPGAFAADGATELTAEVRHARNVTVRNPGHGQVIILAPLTVYDGDTVRFIVTPEPGYYLYAAYYGEEDVTAAMTDGAYTATVSGDIVFRVVFAAYPVVTPHAEKPPAIPFTDVPEDEYFYDAVVWAVKNGVTKGTSETTFSPYVPVTRAEVVTFLWRIAGSPEPKGDASRFTDVPENEFYTKAVAWAIEQVVTKGTSKTTFSPEQVCTRCQFVTFLARFAGVEDADTRSVFSDVKRTDYFAAAVRWAKTNGITKGTSAMKFSPHEDCTRAQATTFLYRWMVGE